MTDVKLTDDDICTVATILCRQAGWEPDGLYSVDDGPLLKGWHHFENKARALLAGLPEPTEKQIVDAIFTGHPLGLGERELESARRVQQLYRSRRHG